MDEELKARAESRYEGALQAADLRDPREQFRDWMRQLREADAPAFQAALRYFEEILIPSSADPGRDAIAEWIEYGRRLADRIAPGRVVTVDASGRSEDYEPPPPRGGLVLHLPTDDAARASILSLPRNPSPAQRATCDLLVLGKVALGRE